MPILEFSRCRTLLEELNEQVKDKNEKLEDQGFDEHAIRDIEMPMLYSLSDKAVGCNEVVLYNTVRKTFNELVNSCVLKKYGVKNT